MVSNAQHDTMFTTLKKIWTSKIMFVYKKVSDDEFLLWN